MSLFDFKPRSSKASDSEIIKKSSLPTIPKVTNLKIKNGTLADKIRDIRTLTEKNLAYKKAELLNITSESQLKELIDLAIKNKHLSVDTETTSLDPLTTTLAGVCLYTKGYKSSYIPINHVNFITGVKYDGQLSEDFVKSELQRYIDSKPEETVMFNGDFDRRVLRHTLGIEMECTWDAYIAARLLDENNPVNKLKPLWDKYVGRGQSKSLTFDEIFHGIPFNLIPLDVAYLYAANDPLITDELYDFQCPYLTPGTDLCKEYDLEQVAWLFRNIEMKVLPIVGYMEDTGIEIDLNFQHELSVKYNQKLLEIEEKFYRELENYQDLIRDYRYSNGSSCKLPAKINIGSSVQLAILFYDILKLPVVSKKEPRGTGEKILSKMDNPLCKIVLEYREVGKLLSTYIDKFSEIINPKTGRVHCRFNQVGAVTGRFSSSDPNLQNIPSHNKEIRKMFKATEGYYMLSCDYSAQEPRLTVHLAKDKVGIQAYLDGKDLYAEIASLAFEVPYTECLEFRPDGTHNPEGKERRGRAKAIFLGICYGKGIKAIADDLGITEKHAQQIYDAVLTAFPGLKQFMEDSQTMAEELGYVTTNWGRKRRLPDMQLPKYEFSWLNGISNEFDPLADEDSNEEVPDDIVDYYWNKLDKCRGFKAFMKVIEEAEAENIKIVDNRKKIADATRQCVNSRVQGSAADLTKLALIKMDSCQELKDLGFRMLIPVHDEIIGEFPKENTERVVELVKGCMVNAAKISVPLKCDVEITKCWYGEEVELSH